MKARALISGSPDRVAALSAELTQRDCEVVAVDDLGRLADVCESVGNGAIDHYVQLPVNVPSTGGTVVGRLRTFLSGGLLARFEAVSSVLPTLRPNASVVLVAGNLPGELTAPDDRQARISLLRVLAQAILADTAPMPVRTAVVEHSRTPYQIAEITLDPTASRLRVISEAAERYPDMTYDDWRLAVLSLATIES